MRRSNVIATVIVVLIALYVHKLGWRVIYLRPAPTLLSKVPITPTADPLQENFPTDTESPIITKIDGQDTLLIPKATYRIAGRVVSTRHYYMDWNAKLSPVDLALAWGPMASSEYDTYVSYRHTDRFYHYSYSKTFPGNSQVIAHHTANEHLVPANAHIAKVLKSIKVDEIIELEGFLINVEGPMMLETSLTREDSGAGACEIIYVRKVRIGEEVFL
jgi:hypothetical protein